MRYRVPKSAARLYAQMMEEIEAKYVFVPSQGAIRRGCRVEYVRVEGEGYRVINGEVIRSSYGADRGQHTFTIQDEAGAKYLVKGRNLYPRLLAHTPGEESKKMRGTI